MTGPIMDHLFRGTNVSDAIVLIDGVVLNADCSGHLYIGDQVINGPNVIIHVANRPCEDPDVPVHEPGHDLGEILQEDDVWHGTWVATSDEEIRNYVA